MTRPPRMRSGPLYEAMIATFDGCAAAGAELLSIESVGGKEVHDEALLTCDLPGVLFGLCVLGVRDMRFLWTELDRIARKHHAYILSPESAIAIAQSIVAAPDPFSAGQAAARTALRLIREGHGQGLLRLAPREVPWLDRMEKTLDSLPATEPEFINRMLGEVDTGKFVAADYEIG